MAYESNTPNMYPCEPIDMAYESSILHRYPYEPIKVILCLAPLPNQGWECALYCPYCIAENSDRKPYKTTGPYQNHLDAHHPHEANLVREKYKSIQAWLSNLNSFSQSLGLGVAGTFSPMNSTPMPTTFATVANYHFSDTNSAPVVPRRQDSYPLSDNINTTMQEPFIASADSLNVNSTKGPDNN
ncbi:hypothetical protein F5Y19DRAFT_483317 [Xylariaceae sp. FL1651]|nr:hypothetical protein F5Y19DRAFT_483317 [Xylariaceae sp. FL1651]